MAPCVETCAGLLCFGERFVPCTFQLEHLGPADQAFAAEQHVWVRITPGRKRGGPFFCAAQVEEVMTRAEHAAVDDTGDDGVDLAARHANHPFSEHCDA